MTGKIMRAALMSANWTAPTARILDQFTDTNGTLLQNHVIAPTNINEGRTKWRSVAGGANLSIQNNRVQGVSGQLRYICHASEPDVTVTAVVRLSAANGNDYAILLIRYVNEDSHWYVYFSNTTFIISQHTSAGDTTRASTPFTPSANTDYTLRVVCSGSTITATIDGANSISYAGATQGQYATAFGIYLASFDAGASYGMVDSFQIVPAQAEALWIVDSPVIYSGAVDEFVAEQYLGGKVYCAENLVDGKDFTEAGGTLTQIDALGGRTVWRAVYDAANNKIVGVGIGNDAEGKSRAALHLINTTNDTESHVFFNVAGKETDTVNELNSILDDGTRFLVGERCYTGAEATHTNYPNAAGLWTCPKATLTDASTFTRVYEDPNKWAWNSIVKRGSTYYAYIGSWTNGAYYIKSSTDLTTWSTEIDGSALSIKAIWGSMVYHSALDLVIAFTPDASQNIVLRRYNGSAWAAFTTTIPAFSTTISVQHVLSCFVVDATRVALIVGNGWDGAEDACHDLYVFSDLDTTPTYVTKRVSLTGTAIGQAVINGSKIVYGTQYPGKLIQQAV